MGTALSRPPSRFNNTAGAGQRVGGSAAPGNGLRVRLESVGQQRSSQATFFYVRALIKSPRHFTGSWRGGGRHHLHRFCQRALPAPGAVGAEDCRPRYASTAAAAHWPSAWPAPLACSRCMPPASTPWPFPQLQEALQGAGLPAMFYTPVTGFSALHKAAQRGDEEDVAALLAEVRGTGRRRRQASTQRQLVEWAASLEALAVLPIRGVCVMAARKIILWGSQAAAAAAGPTLQHTLLSCAGRGACVSQLALPAAQRLSRSNTQQRCRAPTWGPKTPRGAPPCTTP